MNAPKRILFSPLNWGLGHATRMIPLIHHYHSKGHTCFVAGEQPSLAVIQNIFPQIKSIETKGFNIKLTYKKHQWFKLLTQLPAFLRSIKEDKKQAGRIVKTHCIDVIISDNRYGLYHKKCISILVTHQTNPFTPKWMAPLKPLIKGYSKMLLRPFNQIWIPDYHEDISLSGNLSLFAPKNKTHKIGILSRLTVPTNDEPLQTDEKPEMLAIISGPEPQRSQLEAKLIARFQRSGLEAVILQGLPNQPWTKRREGDITIISHCNSRTMKHLLNCSKTIICRSGYSTIMDLFAVNRTAILVPTPGQYEQEYLADYLSKQFNFTVIQQYKVSRSPRLLPQTHYQKATPTAINTRLNLPAF